MSIKTVVLATLAVASLIVPCGSPASGDEEKPSEIRRPGAEVGGPIMSERGLNQPGQRRFGDAPAAGRGPAQFVTMLMRQFDKDADQKLDSEELTALLTSMRDRQSQMGGQPPMGPMQANRFRPGGMEGRRGGDGNDEPGGVTPKRPPVED